jgi:phosphopantothenoylcysteine decarboxylase / phosphopantothenate---cysteine ligase
MDAVVMAAAVADHRPAQVAGTKLKKDAGAAGNALELVANPDILAARRSLLLRAPGGGGVRGRDRRRDRHGALDLGRRKLATKGCDLLVVNEVGPDKGFGAPVNEAVVLAADGSSVEVPRAARSAWQRSCGTRSCRTCPVLFDPSDTTRGHP